MVRTACGALCLLLFCAVSARAEDAVQVDLVPKALSGSGTPELILRTKVGIQVAVLNVTRSTDGEHLRLSVNELRAGGEHRFPLQLARVGKARFRGTLDVGFSGGDSGSLPVDVEVELLGALEVHVDAADVDLGARKLKVSSNRPLKRLQISLMSDAGAPLGTTVENFDPNVRPEKYALSFKQDPGTIMRISVQAWDANAFFGGVDLFPWRVDIPHDEVNFDSGLDVIDPEEEPKLAKSLELINEAIQKYGSLAAIHLFVAGHTDSVGARKTNRVLSEQRARSIGRWLRQRGLKIPVRYTGFGEDLLLVETPDETDERRNRRAEYIVAVDLPRISGADPEWRELH